jgi:manganese transport protein
MNETAQRRPWYQSIGPGLITACVVIGPGSIMTSSTVGANKGFSMLWVVLISVLFMMVYMTLGARLGVVANAAPCDLIRKKAGSWLAVLLGLCVFFISAAFQSGNNIGVAAAFEALSGSRDPVSAGRIPWMVVGFVILLNSLAIAFLYTFRDLYKSLERLMMVFVGLMLVSFAVNLIVLKPDVGAMIKGFVPAPDEIDLAVLGLIGTTFVTSAAFYQAYLVRQKGMKVGDLRNSLIDARIGSLIMALITVMLMSTAAAGLYTGSPVKLGDPVAVADALEVTFGSSAKLIFCLGLFSAAYSSFLVNSMIGGFICADGLGLGSKTDDKWPRIFTTLVLCTGMAVALAALILNFDRTPTLIAAQAVTVVGAPLVAGVLLWLTSRRDIMGEHVNGRAVNVLAGIGLILLLAMATKTATVDLPKKINDYRAKSLAAVESQGASGPLVTQSSTEQVSAAPAR